MPFPVRLARGLACCVLAVLLAGRPAAAQSLTNGALRGVVLYAADATPIRGVQVTVEGSDGRGVAFLESDGSGHFIAPLLAPGTYRVLAEQVGLQSVRVTGVVVAAGQTTSLSIRLERRPPPVEQVDEIRMPGLSAGNSLGHMLPGNILFTGDRHRSVTDVSRDVADVVRAGDAREGWALSSGGQPANASRLWVDGIPEQLMRHPGAPGEPASAPLFQRDALSQAQIVSAGIDAEWRGYPGSVLAGHTARGGNQLAFRPYATVSSGSLAADTKDNPADSTAISFQVGASLSGAIVRDTAHYSLRFDYQRLQTASPYPWEADSASYLDLPVSLRETIGSIAQDSFGVSLPHAVQPAMRTWQGFSGMGRADWRFGRHDLTLRFGFADWDEESPLLLDERSNLAQAELQSTDLSGAFSLTSNWQSAANELRIGLSQSQRDWIGNGLPATLLATEGVSFGGSAGLPGRFQGRSLDFSDAVQFRLSRHRLKLGASYNILDYEQDYRYGAAGVFTFGGLDQFGSAEGTFFQTVGGGTATPRISTAGLFIQDSWAASPEFTVLLGIRYDRQSLPDDEIQLDQDWATLTGFRNDFVPEDTKMVGPRAGFVWDVQGRGEWIVRAGAGLFASGMDPALFAEAALLDGAIEVRRGIGTFTSWPDAPASGLAPTLGPRLTHFSTQYRNPRAFKGGLGLSRTFTDGTALHVGGAYYHTDYLPRRLDLNLGGQVAETQEGRPVYGTLVQQGGLISPEPASNRAFSTFDLVSLIDAEGFADYYEASILLEKQLAAGLSFSLGYTWSRTTDNVLGQRTLDPADQLNPFPEGLNGSDWTEGRSDFDVPHRAALSAQYRAGANTPFTLGARWRFRSGLPFTPGFRPGVDLNGDGAGNNDPAFLDPDAASALTGANCSSPANTFAERNSCREDPVHALDLRASVGLPIRTADGSRLWLFLDAFNVVSSETGIVDRALLLVDPDGTLVDDGLGNLTVPLVVNPNFGNIISRRNDPRMLRVGLRMDY
ncbi:MAG TPA: TonB-dependent receptor [Gemmatimonadales bacterium]|nr:TonB-dependent receptor [Gemmatimonadales bacterium]